MTPSNRAMIEDGIYIIEVKNGLAPRAEDWNRISPGIYDVYRQEGMLLVHKIPGGTYIRKNGMYFQVPESDPLLTASRAEGAEVVWQFLDRVHTVGADERSWDESTDTKERYGYVWEKFGTYAEALHDFEVWKMKQEWEPQVGDIVTDSNGNKGVVSSPKDEDGDVFVWWSFGGGNTEEVDGLTPTGEHIDLSGLFEKLEG